MNSVFDINTFAAPIEVAEATRAHPYARNASGIDLETAVALARRCER